MTHQELQKQLTKYNLKLVVQPWLSHKFNINPTQAKLSISKSGHSMGVTNLNPFDFKNRNDEYVYIIETQSNLHRIVAQISADESGIWQKDHDYRSKDKKLWNLIHKFVDTPIIKRDFDDYVLFLSKDQTGMYNALSVSPDANGLISFDRDTRQSKYYNFSNCSVDAEDDIGNFTIFEDHFSLSQIHYYMYCNAIPKTAKIFSVRTVYDKHIQFKERKRKWNQIHQDTDFYGGTMLLQKRAVDLNHKSYIKINFQLMAKAFKGTTKKNGHLTYNQWSGWCPITDPFIYLREMCEKKPFFSTGLNKTLRIPKQYKGCTSDYQILVPVIEKVIKHSGWIKFDKAQAKAFKRILDHYTSVMGKHDTMADQANALVGILWTPLDQWLGNNR